MRISGWAVGLWKCAALTRRLYRSDKSRQTKAAGLGLSLVAAMAKCMASASQSAAAPAASPRSPAHSPDYWGS